MKYRAGTFLGAGFLFFAFLLTREYFTDYNDNENHYHYLRGEDLCQW